VSARRVLLHLRAYNTSFHFCPRRSRAAAVPHAPGPHRLLLLKPALLLFPASASAHSNARHPALPACLAAAARARLRATPPPTRAACAPPAPRRPGPACPRCATSPLGLASLRPAPRRAPLGPCAGARTPRRLACLLSPCAAARACPGPPLPAGARLAQRRLLCFTHAPDLPLHRLGPAPAARAAQLRPSHLPATGPRSKERRTGRRERKTRNLDVPPVEGGDRIRKNRERKNRGER
jgi:hypothetical protein